jgi:hypothetical protein
VAIGFWGRFPRRRFSGEAACETKARVGENSTGRFSLRANTQASRFSNPIANPLIPDKMDLQRLKMPIYRAIEEFLQADLVTARDFLDAARDAIASHQLTKEEGKLIHEAARSAYATALRRFSDFMVYGKVPNDLE